MTELVTECYFGAFSETTSLLIWKMFFWPISALLYELLRHTMLFATSTCRSCDLMRGSLDTKATQFNASALTVALDEEAVDDECVDEGQLEEHAEVVVAERIVQQLHVLQDHCEGHALDRF